MGGYPAKITVQACKSLDANDYARWGYFKSGYRTGTLRWTRNGNVTGTCGYYVQIDERDAFIRFSYEYNGEHRYVKVNLSPYSPGFGGKRFFFVCPVCGQRRRTLQIKGGEIACRLCHGLTYQSCQESHRFDSIYRLIAEGINVHWRAVKLRIRMLGRAAIKEPKRPRGRPRKLRNGET